MNKPPQTAWNPPRGITLVEFPLRPARSHGVQWRLNGKRKTKTFKTVEKQIEFAKALAADAKQSGTAAYRLDESEAREWRAFRATIGADTDLAAVAACWERNKPTTTGPVLLVDAVRDYTAAKTAEGVSADSISHYKPIFDRFALIVGGRDLAGVTDADIAAFMEAQKDDPDNTRDTRFRRIRALFNWLTIKGRLARSPFVGVKPPKVEAQEVQILDLAQSRLLFSKNAKGKINQARRETLGRLALEAFAGLRNDTAAQIVASEIQPDGLRIPAAKIKTKRNQFLAGLPANLHAWLKWSKPEGWVMTPRQYEAAKGAAFIRAEIPHPRNCLRHGFASYHVAAFTDTAKTSIIMCHRNPKMLWDTYKGIATQPDGLAYFEIKPPA